MPLPSNTILIHSSPICGNSSKLCLRVAPHSTAIVCWGVAHAICHSQQGLGFGVRYHGVLACSCCLDVATGKGQSQQVSLHGVQVTWKHIETFHKLQVALLEVRSCCPLPRGALTGWFWTTRLRLTGASIIEHQQFVRDSSWLFCWHSLTIFDYLNVLTSGHLT